MEKCIKCGGSHRKLTCSGCLICFQNVLTVNLLHQDRIFYCLFGTIQQMLCLLHHLCSLLLLLLLLFLLLLLLLCLIFMIVHSSLSWLCCQLLLLKCRAQMIIFRILHSQSALCTIRKKTTWHKQIRRCLTLEKTNIFMKLITRVTATTHHGSSL